MLRFRCLFSVLFIFSLLLEATYYRNSVLYCINEMSVSKLCRGIGNGNGNGKCFAFDGLKDF